MTSERPDRSGADIIPLHAARLPASPPEEPPLAARDIHYEIALDPEPASPPVPVDKAEAEPYREPGELLPVIPEHLNSLRKVRKAVAHWSGRQWHRAKWHTVRSPQHAWNISRFGLWGLLRLARRQIAWWWALDQHELREQAVLDRDSRQWMSLHKEALETRKRRGLVLLGELAVVLIAAIMLARYGRWWADLLGGALVITLLAVFGRPPDKPLITPATVTPRFRLLNADIVLRAYYAAGLGHRDKPDQQVTFGSTMARDGDGTAVLVDLPHGKGLKDAMDAKDKIASGLDVTESQVYIHRDPTSVRRHRLWVADRDPLAVPVGRTPLLACRQTDIWKPMPLGLDERGQLVKVPLMWQSVLVGAVPRQGKTFTARLIALYAALDPYVRLSVFDASGKPDWRKFALVADSYAFGLTPNRDGKPPEVLRDSLANAKSDILSRYARLSELPTDVCPEGKLTREIARDLRYRMPVHLIVLEEFQEYYDLDDISKEIAELIRFVIKVGPAAGYILIGATQKPAGIGGGGVLKEMFNGARDNFLIRFALKTASWTVSEAVLGQGTYSMGLDSSALLPDYKGVGILHNASDKSPTVRTHLANGQDAEKILIAARRLRERAGTLSGMALGQETPEAVVSILEDVDAVFASGEAGLQWETLAERLAGRFPERHADCTAESVSAQCRAAGVPSRQVWHGGANRWGCKRTDVMAGAGVPAG